MQQCLDKDHRLTGEPPRGFNWSQTKSHLRSERWPKQCSTFYFLFFTSITPTCPKTHTDSTPSQTLFIHLNTQCPWHAFQCQPGLPAGCSPLIKAPPPKKTSLHPCMQNKISNAYIVDRRYEYCKLVYSCWMLCIALYYCLLSPCLMKYEHLYFDFA